MPKKTKHEKILAAYRNKQKQEQLQSTSHVTSPVIVQPRSQKPSVILENNDTNNITKYFKQDFTKSLFLIIGVITLELIFYFVSMNTNLRSIFRFIL